MPTILVVDDAAVDRRLVDGILRKDPTLRVTSVEDGRAALARLKESPIDVVVTDLQMPEINGLQLVTTIRLDYPRVPVILMTAHGSESLAIEALEQGAASYVPKRQLNDRLLDTVHDVLGLAQADQAYQKLITCFDSAAFTLSLENDPKLFDPLVDFVQQVATGMQLCDATGGYQIGVALRESLLNALYRGNLEITRSQIEAEREKLLQGIHTSLFERRRAERPYCERRVFVAICINRDEARFVIRDQGPGFNVSSIPTSSDAAALRDESGRGLILMRTLMDEVTFNQTGNEVTLLKRRRHDTEPPTGSPIVE